MNPLIFSTDTNTTYKQIRNTLIHAQRQVYTAVNSAMVLAYWEIGEQIFKACGENDRAEYGKSLLKFLADQLTLEFGKGFDETNLRKMRQFYCAFPIRDALRLDRLSTKRLEAFPQTHQTGIAYMEVQS